MPRATQNWKARLNPPLYLAGAISERRYLVCKTNANSKQNAAKDEHVNIVGGATKRRSTKIRSSTNENRESVPEAPHQMYRRNERKKPEIPRSKPKRSPPEAATIQDSTKTHDRGIGSYHIDSRDLLEEWDSDRHHQLRPVPSLQDVLERASQSQRDSPPPSLSDLLSPIVYQHVNINGCPTKAAPARKATPPIRIEGVRPQARVTDEANNEANRPAMYNEDVNKVNSSLSKFAVVANFCTVFLHLSVDIREEPFQEWLH
nr:hypothetical protein MtrunA17_Chr3g0078981 [Ipomoea batatas]